MFDRLSNAESLNSPTFHLSDNTFYIFLLWVILIYNILLLYYYYLLIRTYYTGMVLYKNKYNFYKLDVRIIINEI